MVENFLREAVSLVLGRQFEEIAKLLNSKKPVNEFLIAKKLDITINQTRNLLYKLSDYGLVISNRKKDKKKGWYTYFWRLDILKTLEFLKTNLFKRKEQLDNQIKSRESKKFYVCERCGLEYSEENALLHDFTCEECGEVFTLKDNSKVLKGLKRQLDKIHQEIKEIAVEVDKEQEKVDKIKEKELEREAIEKSEKRKANAKERKRLKAKEDRKNGIKPKPVKKKARRSAYPKAYPKGHKRNSGAKKKKAKKAKKKLVKKKAGAKKKVVKKTKKKVSKKKVKGKSVKKK